MFFGFLASFVLGSVVGSFLNVVIDRTTRGEPIVGKSHWRSYCDHCRATLGTLDLIPVISFMSLSGRCRYCKKPISWQYPLVEILTGFLFTLSFYKYFQEGYLGFAGLVYILLLISILVIVAVVDFKFSLIPTTFVYAGALIAVFYSYLALESYYFVVNVISSLGLAAFFLAIVIVTRGRGMGTGDIPLVFLIGLFLGWPDSLLSVFVAFLAGGAVSVFLLILGKKRFGQTVPFAPFLVLGAIASFFWSAEIFSWYFSLFLA